MSTPALPPELERLVREAVAAVRFGTVALTIHDGRIVQIDRTEKIWPSGIVR